MRSWTRVCCISCCATSRKTPANEASDHFSNRGSGLTAPARVEPALGIEIADLRRARPSLGARPPPGRLQPLSPGQLPFSRRWGARSLGRYLLLRSVIRPCTGQQPSPAKPDSPRQSTPRIALEGTVFAAFGALDNVGLWMPPPGVTGARGQRYSRGSKPDWPLLRSSHREDPAPPGRSLRPVVPRFGQLSFKVQHAGLVQDSDLYPLRLSDGCVNAVAAYGSLPHAELLLKWPQDGVGQIV
jgi:hypothetical protein